MNVTPLQDPTHAGKAAKTESDKVPNGFGTRLLDAKQVAAILNVSEGFVRDHCNGSKPTLPAIKLGEGKTSPVRFHPSDILDFIATLRELARKRSADRRWRK